GFISNNVTYHGLSGDNGPALVGLINTEALAVDASGNVYLADGDDGVVRKLTPAPQNTPAVISTFPFGALSRGGGVSGSTTTLSVVLSGSGTFNWNASVTSGSNWLSISPTSGTGSTLITLTYTTTNLLQSAPMAPVSFNGSITFTSANAVNGSFTVPV